MKVIEQYIELEDVIDADLILRKIENAGRTCYSSHNNITKGSAEKFIQNIIKSGHDSVIEHASISVRIVSCRGTIYELVRHRIASYSQQSSRYCNFSKDKFGNELTFIKPIFDKKHNVNEELYLKQWEESMLMIEKQYLNMSADGVIPEYTRHILPNSLKTEIVATMNLRSWRNFLKLRMSQNAHPQIRDIAFKIFDEFNRLLPAIFKDLEYLR